MSGMQMFQIQMANNLNADLFLLPQLNLPAAALGLLSIQSHTWSVDWTGMQWKTTNFLCLNLGTSCLRGS